MIHSNTYSKDLWDEFKPLAIKIYESMKKERIYYNKYFDVQNKSMDGKQEELQMRFQKWKNQEKESDMLIENFHELVLKKSEMKKPSINRFLNNVLYEVRKEN